MIFWWKNQCYVLKLKLISKFSSRQNIWDHMCYYRNFRIFRSFLQLTFKIQLWKAKLRNVEFSMPYLLLTWSLNLWIFIFPKEKSFSLLKYFSYLVRTNFSVIESKYIFRNVHWKITNSHVHGCICRYINISFSRNNFPFQLICVFSTKLKFNQYHLTLTIDDLFYIFIINWPHGKNIWELKCTKSDITKHIFPLNSEIVNTI